MAGFTSMSLSVCPTSVRHSRFTSLVPPSKHEYISRIDEMRTSWEPFICTSEPALLVSPSARSTSAASSHTTKS